jgi:hypothetical protein
MLTSPHARSQWFVVLPEKQPIRLFVDRMLSVVQLCGIEVDAVNKLPVK